MRKQLMALMAGMLFLFCVKPLMATTFAEFNQCIRDGKLASAAEILETWGDDKETDPQFHVCLYNFHLSKARQTGVGVGSPDSADGAAFKPIVKYDPVEGKKAVDALKEGIRRFPDHFEMRFGLWYACKELKQFPQYLEELEDGLKFLINKKPKIIYWNENEPVEDPTTFVLEGIQENLGEMMGSEELSDKTDFLHAYCDLMIRYFPKGKLGYSNKGVLYYQGKKVKKALEFFKRALALDGDDELIQFNIGLLYKETKDFKNARKTMQKLLDTGKEEKFVEEAKHHLEQMKKP